MPSYPFVTVDVFTDRRFGGNPLAVFTDARGLSDAQMQALARELNHSESTFVLPPENPANSARVRIFTPAYEMPFAGHPNVGTGWVLARDGRAVDGKLRFEEIAGLVEIEVAGERVTIAAPQALSLGEDLPPAVIAACASLREVDIVTAAHRPIYASMGAWFFIAEVTPEALGRASPDLAAFRAARAERPQLGDRLNLHLYAQDGARVRTRMFAPLAGVLEDPATGSANVALGALLLSLSGAESARYEIVQGVEMGRPSLLHVAARRAADGIRATVGGTCVPVLRGVAEL
jgi:trans-2,3-dihydro-3-hydroxyanthranilate isomerase